MNLHKPFLNILSDAKTGTISNMLVELGLIQKGVSEIIFDEASARVFEEICYTVDFLEKNNFVTSAPTPVSYPHISLTSSARAASQTEYLQNLLEKHYGKHLIATPEFTVFAEHGYQVPAVRNREYKTLLLFIKTIVFAVITTLLNKLLL